MNVSVPKEVASGERRVALVPEVVERLIQNGIQVTIEDGAGEGAHHPNAAYEEAGASIGDGFSGDVIAKVAPPSAEEIGRLARGLGPGRLPPAAHRVGHRSRARRARRDELRHGGDPAHHARAVDGRALLPGHRLRLPGRPARRPGAAALLPDAHHGGRHDPPRQGARARRGRGGAPGHRHRAAPRRGGARLRRALGGEGADRVARCPLPRARHGARGRRGGRRLRAPAHRRGAAAPARAARGGDRQDGRGHLDRRGAGPPGPAARDRAGREEHEPRLRDRGPRRRDRRQLRAHRGRPDRREGGRDHRRTRSTCPPRCRTTRRACTRATCSRCST